MSILSLTTSIKYQIKFLSYVYHFTHRRVRSLHVFPFSITIASLKKARLIGLMLACAALALAVILCAAGLVTWVTSALVNLKWGWLDGIIAGTAGIVTGVGGWFMLPALTALIAGMFQERVIHKVEKAYYPDAMREEEPKFWPDILHDIKFTAWALFLNILILPFYLIGIGFFLSIVLNTHLLGREFFESAAGYHLGKPEARKIEGKSRREMYTGGLVITLLTLVPLVNFFVPILAVVWMTHVYHDIRRRGQ